MKDTNIRLRINWKDKNLTGAQFLRQTFDFLSNLVESQKELENLSIYDWPKASVYYEEDTLVKGEQLMRPLALDFDQYSTTVVECLGEHSYCRGFQSFTNDGVPYQRFSSYFTFDRQNKGKELIIKFELSNQLGSSNVTIELGDSYSNEDEVRNLFLLLVEFWHPHWGICGPYLQPGRHSRDQSEYGKKFHVDWLTYRDFAGFGKNLPSLFNRYPCADGQIIEVVDSTKFAAGTKGKELIGDLFHLLDQEGQLDIKEEVSSVES